MKNIRIEVRTPRQNARDRATNPDAINDLGSSGSLTYGWYRKGKLPLWLADAILEP